MQGGWETDETAEEAACREAYEEAGVRGDLKVREELFYILNGFYYLSAFFFKLKAKCACKICTGYQGLEVN